MKLLPFLLTFFLAMMIPQPSVTPVMENYEEKETLIQHAPAPPDPRPTLVQLIHSFPEFLPLAPQAVPSLELRPPALPLS